VFCTVLDPAADGQARPGKSDIWIVAADGTGRVNLTHSEFNNLQPIWASDGSIYFISNRAKGSTDNVYAIRPDRALRMADGPEETAPATAEAPAPPVGHAPVATTSARAVPPSKAAAEAEPAVAPPTAAPAAASTAAPGNSEPTAVSTAASDTTDTAGTTKTAAVPTGP
jgi:hypothetical protein